MNGELSAMTNPSSDGVMSSRGSAIHRPNEPASLALTGRSEGVRVRNRGATAQVGNMWRRWDSCYRYRLPAEAALRVSPSRGSLSQLCSLFSEEDLEIDKYAEAARL